MRRELRSRCLDLLNDSPASATIFKAIASATTQNQSMLREPRDRGRSHMVNNGSIGHRITHWVIFAPD